MKLFGSKSYTDAPPAPKMPQGLIELMEGLTKEVLKNNPTEVYEYCAEHMRKLLELRDHDTPKRGLTLEEKVSKANSVIRQRAEKRREKYDNDMRILQQTEQLIDTSVNAENNLFNDNSERDDEQSNNVTVTESGDIENNETSENFDNLASEGVEKNTDRDQYNQLNENIDDSQINPMQYEICDTAIAADDHTKEEFSKESDANDINDNEENAQGLVSPQENIEIPSKDENNDYVDGKELAEESNTDTSEEKENDKVTHSFDSVHIVAAEETKESQILEIDSNGENGLKEINENAGVVYENNPGEKEEFVYTNNEIKDESDIISEIEQKELEELTKPDDGNQNSIKEVAALNVENNQKEMQEQCFTNDDQNEVETKADIGDKNNVKVIEQQAGSNEQDHQNEIKYEVLNKENNKNGIEDEYVTNKEYDQNEGNEEAIVKDEKNQIEIIKQNLIDDEEEIKEIKEQVTIQHKNEQKEQAKQENDQDDVNKPIDTDNKENQSEIQIPRSSSNEIGQTEIKDQEGDIKLIRKFETGIESEQYHSKESIAIIDKAKNAESETNQEKTVLEITEELSKDSPKDELCVVKDDGNTSKLKEDNVDTNNLTSTNKEPILASEYNVSDTDTVLNSEYLQINAAPSHFDQPQGQDTHEDGISDKPLIININIQQDDHDSVRNENQSQFPNIDNYSKNDTVESKETGVVESKNSKPMDLETAAITIQKVFRNFLFRSKTSSFDDSTNIEFNIFDHDSDSKDIVYSNQSQNLNKEKRPKGISRMDTVLQTVNEEKSLSLSTDDSSTLSSAATVIQAHIRGFLVRNRLNRNKTLSSTSLADSDDPPASFEADPDPAKNKTVLNIHIVPEGSHFLSRDESMLTSVELSLDGSPPASSNLHPLGYNKSERRKQLKREDAVQSISPPSNNSTRLSEEQDSVKEVLFNDGKNETTLAVDDELPADSIISEDGDSGDVLSKGTVEEKQIENPNPVRTPDEKTQIPKVASSDELDVITPFENVDGQNNGNLDGNKLIHSGEFHDVVLPTKVSRNDTSVVRGE